MIFKKQLEETIYDVRNWLNNYNISKEEAYSMLYNAAMDYDYNLEDIFEDYIDETTAEEIAKHELESWGLARLYFFMGDVNFNCEELFRINWYWNLEEVDYDDIRNICDEIEDRANLDEYDEDEEETEETEEETETEEA